MSSTLFGPQAANPARNASSRQRPAAASDLRASEGSAPAPAHTDASAAAAPAASAASASAAAASANALQHFGGLLGASGENKIVEGGCLGARSACLLWECISPP
ncbi:Protein of unknown function [Gryllus bimaculatus]|nr:Protein of unknown function [Gryllus bimaculatus]